MIWAEVSAGCRTNLIFVPQGVKTNSEIYNELTLVPEIKDACKKLFNIEEWIFQHDSAPGHASNATQSWLRGKNIEFISKEE